MAEENAVSLTSIAKSQQIPAKEFEKQYKNHLSGFKNWKQKRHAEKWTLFPKNIGRKLSIDEVAISNGELYTTVTNKAAHGKKKALIAMVKGTKSKDISAILSQIQLKKRGLVEEVTMDFCPNMATAIKTTFSKATIVIDRFHVQQLITEALQEMRIKERWKVIKSINRNVKKAKKQGLRYKEKTFLNGDTKKQLLARSRYLLFKPKNKWTKSQKERADILFIEFPKLKHAYNLSMMFRSFYEYAQTREQAKHRLNNWYTKVEEKEFDSFVTTAEYIKTREDTILNYFPNRSTNASAESFNAKLKGFRALVRGVRDKTFFLFRVAKLLG